IEEFREEALKLRDDYIEGNLILIAPAILPFEVLNAIKYSRKDLSKETLENIGMSLLHYDIKLFSFDDKLLQETISLSMERNCTVYDSAYVSLAIARHCILVTADGHLINKLDEKRKQFVKHVKDLH
ncbi:MAG: type II toxin-antitoxin system VapC family toxin, partial [Candidatus Helarchaeales archaeon]